LTTVQFACAYSYGGIGPPTSCRRPPRRATAARRTPPAAAHARGAARAEQRSLHHGESRSFLRDTHRPLRARRFWAADELPEDERALVDALRAGWRELAAEAMAALGAGRFLRTEENLADASAHWLQLDVRRRGEAVGEHCGLTPATCALLGAHAPVLSPMGQAKFSALLGGARIFPHAGPTNGRLRLHLGLYVAGFTAIVGK